MAGCRRELVEEATATDREVVLGEIAHIIPDSDNGPRADPTYPRLLRNEYANLILLCGVHHPIVDGQTSTYTAQNLRDMKDAHEKWARERLSDNVQLVGFVELEQVCKAIAVSSANADESLTLIPPAEKLEKNRLSSSSANLVRTGLAQSARVAEYVEHLGQLDDTFPDRLRQGFVNQYKAFKSQGVEGDDLFEALLAFATNSPHFPRQAAGLAVLVYLFEKCEVFER